MNQKAKKIHNKCEKLWKEIARLRDGDGCQIREHFPQINIMHTEILQTDHVISRSNKWLFFDTRNSLTICSACNMAKGFKNKSIDRAVDEIVKKREGERTFQELVSIDQEKSANPYWGQVGYFEDVLKKLLEERKKYGN